MNFSAGDYHRKGKSVHLIQFESGIKLVYKPKDLKITLVLHEFIRQLNDLGLNPPFETYTVLPCHHHGWEEWVERKDCRNITEVEEYYQKCGTLLCLFYLFEGKDAHAGNIIASGTNPFLIDLETLFHPYYPLSEDRGETDFSVHSVLTTGFLPMFSYSHDGRGVDVSGLGGEDDVPKSVFNWKNINTDQMHLAEEKQTQAFSSVPRLKGKSIKAENHVDSICLGFKKTYQLIMQHRKLLFKEKKWLSKFEKCPTRVILRATRVYYLLLRRIYMPEALLHEEIRNKELKKLEDKSIYLGKNISQELINEEKNALHVGDIPSFYSYPLSKDILVDDKIIKKNFFKTSAKDIVEHRISVMKDEEMEKQEKFIKQSFLIKKPNLAQNDNQQASMGTADSIEYPEVLAAAEEIANQIKKQAITTKNGALNWLSAGMDTKSKHILFQVSENISFYPMTNFFYSGRAGIAFFFAALSTLSKDEQWATDAFNIINDFKNDIQIKNNSSNFQFGGMLGRGGMLYAMAHIGNLIGKPELIDEAIALAEEIHPQEITKDKAFDIMEGSAGLILILLSLFRFRKKDKLLQLAIHCGETLCAHSQEISGRGRAWKNQFTDQMPLGFAHGTAGIGYALWKLGEQIGEKKFINLAQMAHSYERSFYSKENQNWPHTEQNNEYWTAWCNGAVGIGMSRLSLFSMTEDTQLYNEMRHALERTQSALKEKNFFNLCCGTLGQLQFITEFSKVERSPDIEKIIHQYLKILINRAKQGSQDLIGGPGLFKGDAGLGYTLLRAIDTENRLPQVLLFE